MLDVVKSERITRWLLNKIEEHPDTFIVIIARHFSLVNSQLLDVGYFDNLIEMQPPTKEQRYIVIRDMIAPSDFQSKEVKLLAMSQQTEYFLTKDLYYLTTQKSSLLNAEFETQFEQTVKQYKMNVFP